MNERPWRCSSCLNHGNDSRYCHNHATGVRIQYLRRLLTTAFHGCNTCGFRGFRAIWFIELVLQHSLSGRGLSSDDGATHADDDLRMAEFHNRILEIISFVVGRGIHLPTAL